MSKPGVMVYFDIRPCIARLSLSEKGQLFDAILDYAENGVEPEIDGGLGVAWDFIRPRIDKDSERYTKPSGKRLTIWQAGITQSGSGQAKQQLQYGQIVELAFFLGFFGVLAALRRFEMVAWFFPSMAAISLTLKPRS